MKDIKEKLELIIEKSNGHVCKSCKSYCDGACTFNCVNERNGNQYRFSNKKITSPDYTCSNFTSQYNMSENTVNILRDLLEDIERVNMGAKNLDLLLEAKIDESDFVDMMK